MGHWIKILDQGRDMNVHETNLRPMTGDDIGVGAPLPRYEDLRLVRGAGRYTDDFHFPGETHLVVVRSPHAAARIVSIDTAAARAVPGVLAVLTGTDSVADGLGLINCGVERKLGDGSPMPRPPYHLLAVDAVRFVGDAVAAVVAETIFAAQEAADLVAVAYEDQPSVTTAAQAAQADAPRVWPQLAPDNICYVVRNGNVKAVDEAFARAAHVVRTEHRVSRVSTNAMEPRNAIGRMSRSSTASRFMPARRCRIASAARSRRTCCASRATSCAWSPSTSAAASA
jgi:carbon-monoxide dehydrogenase large subunit